MLALVHVRGFIAGLYLASCASGLARAQTLGPLPAPPPAAAAEDAASLSLLRAVTTTLQRHPALVAARSALELARADELSASAPFDTALTAALGHDRRAAPSFTDTAELAARTDVTSLSLGAGKSLAWGTHVQADVGLARDHVRPAPGLAPLTQTANVGLTVTQPLLRGAGSTGASSLLRVAEFNARAAEDTLQHVAQQQVFNVIIAYWELVSAEQQLALFEASQARAQRLLDETRVLVDRDQRPRGDLRPLEAGLATRKRDVLSLQSARLRAVHALQLAMGIDLAESADWHASDAFPAPGLPAAPVAELTRRALDQRFDLRAARASAQAAAAAQSGAEHNTLPKLDLALSVGYAGGVARDGVGSFFATLGRHVEGWNAGVSLSLELPVENSAQRAERVRASAQRTAAENTLFDLSRNLRNQVVAAHDELRLAVASLGEATQAEQLYDQALADERYKLRAGLATVIDVVLTEDLLTQATHARIATQLDVGVALARLRLELGRLPSEAQAAAGALRGVMDAGVFDGS